MELQAILELPVMRHDINRAVPMRDFLFDLNKKLWSEQEKFSGKRPWGNSGWSYDLFKTLIENGIFPGKLDEDGYIEEIDDVKAKEYVIEEILRPLFYSTINDYEN